MFDLSVLLYWSGEAGPHRCTKWLSTQKRAKEGHMHQDSISFVFLLPFGGCFFFLLVAAAIMKPTTSWWCVPFDLFNMTVQVIVTGPFISHPNPILEFSRRIQYKLHKFHYNEIWYTVPIFFNYFPWLCNIPCEISRCIKLKRVKIFKICTTQFQKEKRGTKVIKKEISFHRV